MLWDKIIFMVDITNSLQAEKPSAPHCFFHHPEKG